MGGDLMERPGTVLPAISAGCSDGRAPDDVWPWAPTIYAVNYHAPLVAVPYATVAYGKDRCRSLAKSHGTLHSCHRRTDHRGMHAAIWVDFSRQWDWPAAMVRAVWGVKDTPGERQEAVA